MIVIISGIGANLASVKYAIERIGKKTFLTNNPCKIQEADYIILPGVGNAKQGMDRLRTLGLIDLLPSLTQPILGICLGMQLLFTSSDEGNAQCLNIIPGKVNALSNQTSLVVPHMGWNQLEMTQTEHHLFSGIKNNSHVYFVHSYAADIGLNTLGTSHYGHIFSAIVNHKNFYGMQFHPECSGTVGKKLLSNFLNL
jgi:glutamine amidotransferase